MTQRVKRVAVSPDHSHKHGHAVGFCSVFVLLSFMCLCVCLLVLVFLEIGQVSRDLCCIRCEYTNPGQTKRVHRQGDDGGLQLSRRETNEPLTTTGNGPEQQAH